MKTWENVILYSFSSFAYDIRHNTILISIWCCIVCRSVMVRYRYIWKRNSRFLGSFQTIFIKFIIVLTRFMALLLAYSIVLGSNLLTPAIQIVVTSQLFLLCHLLYIVSGLCDRSITLHQEWLHIASWFGLRFSDVAMSLWDQLRIKFCCHLVSSGIGQ